MGDMADYLLEQADYFDEDWYQLDADDDGRTRRLHAPGCKGHSVRRVNGATKTVFFGCSEFPRCRWSQSAEPGGPT